MAHASHLEDQMTHAVYTPHPVTLDGQRYEVLNAGETVQQFLDRVIAEADREMLEVRLNGMIIRETEAI